MINFFITFLLLELSSKLSKLSPKLSRVIIASIFGSLYSLIIFVDSINPILLELTKVFASIIIVLTAFKFYRVSVFLKVLGVYYISSFVLLGFTMAICFIFRLKFIAINNSVLYFDLSAPVIIVSALFAYLLSSIFIRLYNRALSKNEIYTLIIENDKEKVRLNALLDTGNRLREPFSNKPVIVVSSSKIVCATKNTRQVPVSTVNGTNILTAFKPDKIILKTSEGEETIENAYIALSDDLGCENYSAIFNNDILSI